MPIRLLTPGCPGWFAWRSQIRDRCPELPPWSTISSARYWRVRSSKATGEADKFVPVPEGIFLIDDRLVKTRRGLPCQSRHKIVPLCLQIVWSFGARACHKAEASQSACWPSGQQIETIQRIHRIMISGKCGHQRFGKCILQETVRRGYYQPARWLWLPQKAAVWFSLRKCLHKCLRSEFSRGIITLLNTVLLWSAYCILAHFLPHQHNIYAIYCY